MASGFACDSKLRHSEHQAEAELYTEGAEPHRGPHMASPGKWHSHNEDSSILGSEGLGGPCWCKAAPEWPFLPQCWTRLGRRSSVPCGSSTCVRGTASSSSTPSLTKPALSMWTASTSSSCVSRTGESGGLGLPTPGPQDRWSTSASETPTGSWGGEPIAQFSSPVGSSHASVSSFGGSLLPRLQGTISCLTP